MAVDLDALDRLHAAATNADWVQVALNTRTDHPHLGQGPCFHLDGSRFCLRARLWAGHGSAHVFVSLADTLTPLAAEIRELRAELEDETALRQLAKELPDMHARVDRLQAENEALRARVSELEKALAEIACGNGPFSRDNFQFAVNVIEHQKELARMALGVRNLTPTDAKEQPK